MPKGEQIPIETEPETEVTDDNLDVLISEKVAAAQVTETREQKSPFDIAIHKVQGSWAAHNGVIAESVNSLDDDFRTANVGESAKMALAMVGIKTDRPEVCIAISAIHITYLKASKIWSVKK